MCSNNMVGPVESPFLTKAWKECQTTLPKMQGLAIDPSDALDRGKWPSWKFTLRDPLLDTSKEVDQAQFTFGGHDVYVWCPFTFFPHAIDTSKLHCIACGSTGVVVDGWTRGFHPILTLHGQKTFLKCRRLCHPNCPHSNDTGFKFSSLHKTLLKTWYPPQLLAALPFKIRGKRFLSLDFLTFANEMHGRLPAEEVDQVLEAVEDAWLQRRQDVAAQCRL